MVLEFLFNPLLAFSPVVAVTIFSVIVLILINIFYRILINQQAAKDLKARTKELNKKMREEQKAGNKEATNKLMSEMMSENSRLMRMTMKPMIISLVIVVVLLPWLSTAYGDQIVGIKDGAGTLKLGGTEYTVQESGGSITVADLSVSCAGTCLQNINSQLYEIRSEGNNVIFAPVVAQIPVSLPFFGTTIGWLGWYIVVSIPFVMLIRKFMKIYV